ncbi:MAG: hypothetical protein HKN85_00045, partial [Gammaproteobacteria bacterium]|nr:hypothetical protein [Gammaproteobacteria bacterium]
LTEITPEEELPDFDKAYRQDWEQRFPLGYVEHRLAWAPTGMYGKWAISHAAVAKVGDSLFVHGGISPQSAGMPMSEINTRVRTALAGAANPGDVSILEDESSPLWYRGWASAAETSENEEILDGVLAAYGVKRMVIAHTPLVPIVLPRFGGKVLMVDVGLSKHYGHGFSALVIKADKPYAILADQELPIPEKVDDIGAYLDTAAALLEDPAKINHYKVANQLALQAATAVPESEPGGNTESQPDKAARQ